MYILGREEGLNCEVAPLPAPSPTHPPTTLAVRTASVHFYLAASPQVLILKFLAAKIVKF